mmetsp:Transcript_8976/g.24456  ORF Transcript_8976/g.24456 Transcript_8976/m.24456 type:complete len:225 (-) Transcript_8976:470-1144(-)
MPSSVVMLSSFTATWSNTSFKFDWSVSFSFESLWQSLPSFSTSLSFCCSLARICCTSSLPRVVRSCFSSFISLSFPANISSNSFMAEEEVSSNALCMLSTLASISALFPLSSSSSAFTLSYSAAISPHFPSPASNSSIACCASFAASSAAVSDSASCCFSHSTSSVRERLASPSCATSASSWERWARVCACLSDSDSMLACCSSCMLATTPSSSSTFLSRVALV